MRVWTGVIPPKKIFNRIVKIKKEIAKKYKTYHALESKIGPHITITSQGNVNKKDFKEIEKIVKEVSKETRFFKIKINGVARFYKNKIIYIKILKNKRLSVINKELYKKLKQFGKIRHHRDYKPHMTIAYKDITKENFKKAFKELKNKKISFEFTVNRLYLGKSRQTEKIKPFKSFKLKF